MKKRLPPLNWLRSFEASARHLNFTSAANELNLTQAAISQQIKGLESQLRVTLFRRLPRGLELTEAGKAYMPAVREAIDRLAAVTDELFGEVRNAVLNVRVNLVFFTTWLAPRLSHFRTLHPDGRLQFSSNIWDTEQDDRGADIEVRYGRGVWPGYVSHRLTWDELFPVCSPVLGLLPTDSLEHALSRFDLLHVIGYEEGWGYWLKQVGLQQVDASRGMQFDTLITALEMAALGHGLCLGRSSLVADMLTTGQLVAPFHQKVSTDEAFYAVVPEHHYSTPYAKAFLDWLLAEAEACNRGS
ncbi:LysR family transcriptional regulator [Pseudomonas aeruginosa]|uniref:LysR substrate-binding domain-containing protein n=1 Tax=Pseudomonas aeruginosa TaxID=287 RepID=UPI00114DEBEA|nr:LysR substrate-binding domain-containing protein [Pseudomonas aeruginosa]TQI33288.1 LysR family transcriptional regulator [Pseudomonas aeruginosa]